jgi:tetratricopeptide (TPR) repeat protein
MQDPTSAPTLRNSKRWWTWLGLVLVLLLAWLCYLPGLSGGFLFDDFTNLNAIGATGPVDDWPTFWRYVTSGTADPTGRPVAMLSFLLEARDWPADPYPFLRDNVLLHLGNACLLFVLLRRLGRVLPGPGAQADAAALLASSLWLLHPLLVSTTLYAVQRQAMLPATFTLLGLIGWTIGRQRFSGGKGRGGLALMAASILVASVLGAASKANGALLPLLALVLEATVLRHLALPPGARTARTLKWAIAVLLVLPSLLLFAWLASYLAQLGDFMPSRGWSIGQRLLTEPRVLLHYLQLLVAPRPVSSGLFNEDYVVSTGLFSPLSTLPSIALVGALLAFAWQSRRRSPALSAALLFYFAAHLLESTVVPLELYFEHRNYVPALLLFWPLALAIVHWRRPLHTRALVSGLLVLLFAFTTWQRSGLWGDPERMALTWAAKQPGSSRAQSMAAIADSNAGRPDAALRRLAAEWQARPHDLQIAFNFIDARCALDGPTGEEKRKLAEALRRTERTELLTYNWLANAIGVATRGECPGLVLADVEAWVAGALQNPVVLDPHVRNQDFEPLLAQLAIARKQPDVALRHFNTALLAAPNPNTAARQAVMLAEAGYYAQAIAHLDVYESVRDRVRKPGRGMSRVHAWVLEQQGYWPHELGLLRSGLQQELRRSGKPK